MAKSYFEEFKSWLMDEGKDPKTITAYLYSINLFSDERKESNGLYTTFSTN